MAKETFMEQLERLHRYMGLNEAGLPAAVKQKVGNVLFGQSPQLAQLQGKPQEPNTDYEDELFQHLLSWTNSSTDQTSSRIVNSVAELKFLQKYFPKVLKPRKGEAVYRGTAIHLTQLTPWLKANPQHQVYGAYMMFTTPYPYKPRRTVSSWSTSFYFATFFQGNTDNIANVPVVLQTTVDDSFLLNPKATNLIFKNQLGDDMNNVRDEDEVIKIDPNGHYYLIISDEEYQNIMNPRGFDED